MSFNYLQTDDRDDYFKQFERKKKRKAISVTLINPEGKETLSNVSTYKCRLYTKKTYLGQEENGKKGVWRQILLEKGYKVINNHE